MRQRAKGLQEKGYKMVKKCSVAGRRRELARHTPGFLLFGG
jgi:hypothetical protein